MCKLGTTSYERLSIFIQALGFIGVVGAIVLTYGQVKASGVSLAASTHQNIISHTMEIDKLFIDNPELWPYFFDDKEIAEGDQNYDKALAVGYYHLDFFDTFVTQENAFSNTFPGGRASRDAWYNYMHNTFRSGPIMCKVLHMGNEEKSYEPEFVAIFDQDCPDEFPGAK